MGKRSFFMRIFVILGLFGFIASACSTQGSDTNRSYVLSLEVIEHAINQESLLKLTLKNFGTEQLEISIGDLPWNSTSPFILLALAPERGSNPIQRRIRQADRIPGSLALKPGEVATGEINLDRLFPGFSELHGNEEVVLFWTYQPGGPEFSNERSGGCLIIPAR